MIKTSHSFSCSLLGLVTQRTVLCAGLTGEVKTHNVHTPRFCLLPTLLKDSLCNPPNSLKIVIVQQITGGQVQAIFVFCINLFPSSPFCFAFRDAGQLIRNSSSRTFFHGTLHVPCMYPASLGRRREDNLTCIFGNLQINSE